jgi:protein-disulfide isomerase
MAFKKEIEIIIEPKDVFVGDEDAPVTLMEFGEYESEACAKANEVVKQLLEEYDGKIKFNFRHFPQTKIHQRSLKASEAAVAAVQEGKFWECTTFYFKTVASLVP